VNRTTSITAHARRLTGARPRRTAAARAAAVLETGTASPVWPLDFPWSWHAARAFTLLEVLLVVAIVALLVAILVPGLDAARRQTRRALCASHLGQLAKAWHLFLDDNRGRFYQTTRAELNYGGRQGTSPQFGATTPVSKPLNRYLGLPPVTRDKAEVFMCPCDTGTRFARPTCHSYYGTSYKTNPMLIGQTRVNERSDDPCLQTVIKPLNKRLAGLNRSEVANESRLLLMGDVGWDYRWDYAITEVVYWHHQRAFYNLAFMDGHVRFTRIRKGIHVAADYTVIPFRDLQAAAAACQQEVPDAN